MFAITPAMRIDTLLVSQAIAEVVGSATEPLLLFVMLRVPGKLSELKSDVSLRAPALNAMPAESKRSGIYIMAHALDSLEKS